MKDVIRMPPDGSGRRFGIKHILRVAYNSKGSHQWVQGEYVVFQTNWFSAKVVDWLETSTDSGILFLEMNKKDLELEIEPTIGEDIYSSDGLEIYARVVSFMDIHYNQTQVVGKTPKNVLEVDDDGALNVQFKNGEVVSDSYGQVVTKKTLVEYDFKDLQDFSVISTDGSVQVNDEGLILSNGTSASSKVEIYSNQYHSAALGHSLECLLSVSFDSVSSDVVRRFGLFDSDNGVGFQVDSELKVFIKRGDILIEISETETRRYLNGALMETLNKGFSGEYEPLDLQIVRTYWIDFHADGESKVDFGYLKHGKRIKIHSYKHHGQIPVLSTNSLPLAVTQEVVNNVPNTPETNVWKAAIRSDSVFEPARKRRSASLHTQIDLSSGPLALIGVLSPEPASKTRFVIEHVDASVHHSSGEEGVFKIELVKDPHLSGITESYNDETVGSRFSAVNNSKMRVADSTTTGFFGGGLTFDSRIIKGSQTFQANEIPITNYTEGGSTIAQAISGLVGSTGSEPVRVVTDGDLKLREGHPVVLEGIGGDLGSELNGQTVYLKIVGNNTVELYSDPLFTTAVTSTAGASGSGGYLIGQYGSETNVAIIAEALTRSIALGGTVDVYVNITWSEI